MKDKTLEGREVEWLGLEYSDYNLDDYCKFLYSNDYINADYTSLGVYGKINVYRQKRRSIKSEEIVAELI